MINQEARHPGRFAFPLPTFAAVPLLEYRALAPTVGLGVWLLTESEADLLAVAPAWLRPDGIPIRFTHPQRRREWLAGRVLATAVAGRLTGNADATPLIVTDTFGRPRFGPELAGALSLTHGASHVAALVALGTGARAALDLEAPRAKTLTLATRFLSAGECAAVGPDPDRAALAWSLKETLYKAYGRRGLDFRTHLHLALAADWPALPTPLPTTGTLTGRIGHPTDPARVWAHRLHFERHAGGWLTYCFSPGGALPLPSPFSPNALP